MELFTQIFKSLFMDLFKSNVQLELEITALRLQLATYKRKGIKPHIHQSDRLFWIQLSKRWARWKDVFYIVKPETVLRWHRRRIQKMVASNHKNIYPGAPRIPENVVEIIEKLACENRLWGAPRIHGELMKLGFKVSERSVSRYMRRHHPKNRGQGWKNFLKNHRPATVSIDFFYAYTLTLKRICGFVVVDHQRRKILHIASTHIIDHKWIMQQLLNAFPGDCNYKYLICDNDRLFQTTFEMDVKDLLGLKVRKIVRFSPWMNGVTERTIGSIRRELLDHVVVLNESHMDSLLVEYKDYFNSTRTHLTLDKGIPDTRPPETDDGIGGKVRKKSFLGGLHHRYSWAS